MEKEPNSKGRNRHDYFYFLVATRYYFNFKSFVEDLASTSLNTALAKTLKEIQNKKNPDADTIQRWNNDKDLKEFTQRLFLVKGSAHIVVIFSALCLEAIINDYGIQKKSGNYFKNHFDKLDTLSKWVIIPQNITGKQISSDSQTYELLQELFSLRNSMVHPKSITFDVNTYTSKLKDLFLKQVHRSYQTIKEATKSLHEIDPTFSHLDQYKFLWDKEAKFSNISDIESLYHANFSS